MVIKYEQRRNITHVWGISNTSIHTDHQQVIMTKKKITYKTTDNLKHRNNYTHKQNRWSKQQHKYQSRNEKVKCESHADIGWTENDWNIFKQSLKKSVKVICRNKKKAIKISWK